MTSAAIIDGERVHAADGAAVEVFDPADDAVVGTVPSLGGGEVAAAIDSAARAFRRWGRETAAARAEILRRWALLLRRDRASLASGLVREQGKPHGEAEGEVDYAASFLEHAAAEGPRHAGSILPSSEPRRRILAWPEPLGVAAVITPWNFPLAMVTRKLGSALAAGCTAVLKPDHRTPLTALRAVELAMEAGMPRGVINAVTGEAEAIGEALLSDPRVRVLSFTGSTRVGRILMAKASRHLIRPCLELGGHAPFIVFEDADIEHAVSAAVACKFRNAGQTCICANRFLVERGIAGEFSRRLAAIAGGLPVGRGSAAETRVGPLIDDPGVAKAREHLVDALDRGASALCGAKPLRLPGLADRFVAPAVLEGLDPSMRIWREETFGPIAAVRSFGDEAEAVELANDSPSGLAAYLFTRDASRLMRVAERLECGIVGANDATPSTAEAPFGGTKQSGFGREGGRWGLEEFTSVKYLAWGL
jgi:succinate-semialdehyde dehydrogenase/glutarate-semialdehyde dehydrogenase